MVSGSIAAAPSTGGQRSAATGEAADLGLEDQTEESPSWMNVWVWIQLQDAGDTLFLRTRPLSLKAEWLEDLICGLLLSSAASFTAA